MTVGRTDDVDRGDTLRITCTFTNLAGVATDPTTIRLEHKLPDGTVNTFLYSGGQVTKQGVGIYYRDITFANGGRHYLRFSGTGTVNAADNQVVNVRKDAFE